MFFVPYANEGPPSIVSSDRLWAPFWYFYTARNFDLGMYVKWRWLSGQSTGFVVERSRVRVPAGAAGELSSPGSTFCADSYFGIRSTSVLPQQHVKIPVILPKVQSACYIQTLMHLTYVTLHEMKYVTWCMVV